jgi:hypothetical protein
MDDALVNNPKWQDFASNLEQDRGLPPGLLAAVAHNETAGGHPSLVNATSPAGAQGMYQFMPATAKQYNVNVSDTADSTRGAADYLSDLHKKYGDPLLAGAAYDWGPSNVDNAIKAAQGAGVPTDAMSLAQHGFLPKETSAYVVKLAGHLPATSPDASPKPFSQAIIDQTRTDVAQMAANGAAPATIVENLSKSPVAPMIQHLMSSGVSPEDIVKQVGGEPLAKVQAAQDKINNQGFLTNAVQGAGNAVGDLGSGATQLISRATGNDALLAQEQAKQKQAEADPERIALGNTAGGMVGSAGVKSLPYIAAGAATGGAGVIPTVLAQGAAGAADGALTPTTDKGQILSNVLGGAALGAGTAGVGAGASKLAGKVLGSAGGKLVEAGTPKVDPAAIQQELAQAVGARIGVPGATRIDTDLINASDAVHKPMFEAAADGNTVTIPKGFGAKLQPLVEDLNTTPKSISNLMNNYTEGETIPAANWLKLRSQIGADAKDAVGCDKHTLGQIIPHLDDALENSSSISGKQLADLKQAREIYRNLQPVEAMVAASRNTPGFISPQQFGTAVKTAGGIDAFARGNAPLQDLHPILDPLKGNVFDKIAANTKHTDSDFTTYMGAEALGHIIPHIQPVIIGAKLAGKVLGTQAGRAAATGTGNVLQGAGKSLSSNPAIAAVLANLLRKGVGQSNGDK